MGKSYRSPLTEEQIINIAKREPFYIRTDGYSSMALRRAHRTICNKLCSEGVLKFDGSNYTGIYFSFVSIPGCPKLAEQYRLRKKGLTGNRFSKERVLGIVKEKGFIATMRKPKSRKQQSLANQCQNLLNKGLLSIKETTDKTVIYHIT